MRRRIGRPRVSTWCRTPIRSRVIPTCEQAEALYGPWLYTLLTDAHTAVSEAGVAARATGYTSQALLDALPVTHLMQLVIRCGTYPEAPMHTTLRDDHWLHLYGDPGDALGKKISGAFESFLPADDDWLYMLSIKK
ncbi:DUF2817 domain-containing protein [Paraburkholderia fungorum]|uniref:DUF2817 domain-containing protein n=1 Tax=Paraburkholderia fungorum TaxID=134537 RepID=UPI002097F979|nr:DUF2817 domain-containing protein [Paraburkholderia fungorum]USX10228.1 M14 family metallopeptidase [Paraburkholderia fungorum]